jgi:hypothetical protein
MTNEAKRKSSKGKGASSGRVISDDKGGPDFSFVDQLAPYGIYRESKHEYDNRVDIEHNKKHEEMFSLQNH